MTYVIILSASNGHASKPKFFSHNYSMFRGVPECSGMSTADRGNIGKTELCINTSSNHRLGSAGLNALEELLFRCWQ